MPDMEKAKYKLRNKLTVHTANSIKVVLKKREKVEYERDRLVGNDYSFIPEYITIYRFFTKFKIKFCFLININHDQESLETKFCLIYVPAC